MTDDFFMAAPAAASPSPSTSSQQQQQQLPFQSQHLVAHQHPKCEVSYQLAAMSHSLEDILVCVDADRQVDGDMKIAGAKGQTLSRLDAIKQAIFLFVHSKLAMHPQHRFAFTTLTHTVSSIPPNFTNDKEVINSCVRNLSSSGNFPQCDLSLLFRLAASESKKAQKRGRILRVILIYCRSAVVPVYPSDWPHGHYSLTFDALYLHDKPSQLNCPQRVYDALVEALERVSVGEGYIYESGSGLTRVLFRQMCCLLAHPQQRCGQDDFDVPKDISKVILDGNTCPVSIKREDDGVVQQSVGGY